MSVEAQEPVWPKERLRSNAAWDVVLHGTPTRNLLHSAGLANLATDGLGRWTDWGGEH